MSTHSSRPSLFHLLSIEAIELVLSYCRINDADMLIQRRYSQLCDEENTDYTPSSFCVASRLSTTFYRIARKMSYRTISLEIPVYHQSLCQSSESESESDFASDEVIIGTFSPRLQDLFDILYCHNAIIFDIHHVKVSFTRLHHVEEFDPARHATDYYPGISVLEYFASFHNLRSFSIQGITHALGEKEHGSELYGENERDGMDWRIIPAELQASLWYILECPTLERVELINLSHFPLSHLWLSGHRPPASTLIPPSRPKDLAFVLHHVSDDPTVTSPWYGYPPCVEPSQDPIYISSLRLVQPTLRWSYTTACVSGTLQVSSSALESASHHVKPLECQCPIQLSKIRDLAVAVKDPRDECIAMLLSACGKNLETLELDIRSGWMKISPKAQGQLPTLDLSHLQNLRQLTFRISPETPISWVSSLLKTLPPRTPVILGPDPSHRKRPLDISIYLDTCKHLKKLDRQRIYNIRSALSGLNWGLFVNSVLSLQGSASVNSVSSLCSPFLRKSEKELNVMTSPLPMAESLCDSGSDMDMSDSSTTVFDNIAGDEFDFQKATEPGFNGTNSSRQNSTSTTSTKVNSPVEAATGGLSVALGIEASSLEIGKQVYRVLDRDTSLSMLANVRTLDMFVVEPDDD